MNCHAHTYASTSNYNYSDEAIPVIASSDEYPSLAPPVDEKDPLITANGARSQSSLSTVATSNCHYQQHHQQQLQRRRNRHRLSCSCRCIAILMFTLLFAMIVCAIVSILRLPHHKHSSPQANGNDYNNDDYYSNDYDTQQQKQIEAELIYSEQAAHNLQTGLNTAKYLRTATESDKNSFCDVTVVILRHCESNDADYDDYGDVLYHKKKLTKLISPLLVCNDMGRQRSDYIATLFGNDKNAPWPSPFSLYALGSSISSSTSSSTSTALISSSSSSSSYLPREVQTLQPLHTKLLQSSSSKSISTPITQTINRDYTNPKALAHTIFDNLRNGTYSCPTSTQTSIPEPTQTVIIVATHSYQDIPKLAQELGCGPVPVATDSAIVSTGVCPMEYEIMDYDSVWEVRFVYRPSLTLLQSGKPNGDVDVDGDANSKMEELDWNVVGTVVSQGFDPLAYEKRTGVYGR